MKTLRSCFVILASLLVSVPATFAADPAVNLRRTAVVEVVEKTKDAVVYISSTKLVVQRVNPFGDNPMFQNFDSGIRAIVPSNSLGSGFIVHPDGYIVTNNHVVESARQITVQLLDGRKFDAEVLSADAQADLAIIKIKADKPLPALELGDTSDLMVGEPVIAVGNPLGYSHSVSTGIVSAIHRDLQAGADRVIKDLIQTDAAINPGNSGGPLLNAYGQVIGINTAIRGDAQNIGFAIQINRLRDLIPELMSPAQVNKLEVPLRLKEKRTITAPANLSINLERSDDSATVTSIAGIKPHDIVDAYAILLKQKEGKSFEVAIDGHRPMRIDPKPIALPSGLLTAKNRLGIVVEEVTPMLAQKLGLPIENGVVITQVEPDSIAAHKGLQVNDVIFGLFQARIKTMDDFLVAIKRLPEHGDVPIGILRIGEKLPGYGELNL